MIAGDWRYFWPQTLQHFSPWPQAWDNSLNTGVGMSAVPTLWISQYLNLTASLAHLGIPWRVIELVFWLLPPLIVGFVSSYFFYRLLFARQSKWYGVLSSLIYVSNTYMLMIYLGGQVGLSLAFACVPIVFWQFYRAIEVVKKQHNLRQSVLLGVAYAILALFDIRVCYIVLLFLCLYWVLFERKISKVVRLFFLPGVVALLLHSYWLLPLLASGAARSSSYVSSLGGGSTDVSFFSFADLTHSFSLLHPNWPENIFGKVYFMRPEFLMIPILGSLALWQNKKKHIRYVIYFASMVIVGAFLAKGANEPFGIAYEYLFQYVPGFSMFRDPVKFYLLIAIGYSVLIPQSVRTTYMFLNSRLKWPLKEQYVLAFLIVVWIGLSRQGLYQLFRSFPTSHRIPDEYSQLAMQLSENQTHSRSLWIPQWQRFGYFSDLHPAIGRFEVLDEASAAGQLESLVASDTRKRLARLGVSSIIVPIDTHGELFLTDRRYDDSKRSSAIDQLMTIEWLRRDDSYDELAVFYPLTHNGLFFESDTEQDIPYEKKSNSRYILSINQVSQFVFSQAYSDGWILRIHDDEYTPQRTYDGLMQFRLPQEFTTQGELYFLPQKYLNIGVWISLITLSGLALYFFRKS